MLQVGFTEENFARLDFAQGGLLVDIELPDGFDVFIEEFDSNRIECLPGKDIDDSAAEAELPSLEYLGFLFVSGLFKAEGESTEIERFPDFQNLCLLGECAGRRGRFIQCFAGEGNDGTLPAVDAFVNLFKDCEAFGCRFWIGQTFLKSGPLILGEKQGLMRPDLKFCLNHLLGFDVRTNYPDCRIQIS